MFAKVEFTNPIPQKILRNQEILWNSTNKGQEFHNVFKFCGTTPQIIPTHVFFDRSSILWKIDSAFASPLPLRIPQIKSGFFWWNLDLKIPHSQTLYWARVLSSYKYDNNYNDCKYTLGFSDSVPTMLTPPYILRQLPMSIIKLGLWWPNRPYRPRPDGPGRPRPEPDVCSALPALVVKY